MQLRGTLNNFSVINGQWMAKRNASLLETTVPFIERILHRGVRKFRMITDGTGNRAFR
jgi:hypothetical protein